MVGDTLRGTNKAEYHPVEFEDSLDAAIDLPDIKSASKGDTEHVERL